MRIIGVDDGTGESRLPALCTFCHFDEKMSHNLQLHTRKQKFLVEEKWWSLNVRIIGVYDDGTGFVATTEHPVPFWRETFSQPLEAFEQKKGILVKSAEEKKSYNKYSSN